MGVERGCVERAAAGKKLGGQMTREVAIVGETHARSFAGSVDLTEKSPRLLLDLG